MTAWRERASALKREVYTLYYAVRHPRTPWYAKAVAGLVAAYAFSPIDLIPDPIPVLGHLDDLILIPLGVALAIRLIPPDILAECRMKAQATRAQQRNWIAAGVIVIIWLLLAWAVLKHLAII